jgi:2-polyprenyl-3-methyl-5-hydroxy-6-metoxy-1,4-benzoquinol methylase
MSRNEDPAVIDLCELISRRTGKDVICFTDQNPDFGKLFQIHQPESETADIRELESKPRQSYSNVILFEIIENYEDADAHAILEKSWDLLREKGRLFVVAANEEAYRHDLQINIINRKQLKRRLEYFGKPELMKDQPFKWLMMKMVNRKSSKTSEKLLSSAKRYRVVSNLCKGRVIEFGCGQGELTNEIHSRKIDITGIDISRKKIDSAREKFPDIPFYQHDATQPPFADSSFDTVLLPEILEHLTEDQGDRLLKSAWRILKPGGRLIVSVPNEACIPHPNHIRRFSRKSLKRMLKPFGSPQLVVEQPYKWLIMWIDKKKSACLPSSTDPHNDSY